MLFVNIFSKTNFGWVRVTAPVIFAVGALIGCAGFSEIHQIESFYDHYSAGEFDAASSMIGGSTGLDYPEEQLLRSLHVGMSLRAAGRLQASQIAFDRAEAQLLWKSDAIASTEDLLSAGLALVGNDLMLPYHGTIYEGILVNTFKATNAIMLGDIGRARVELNRARDRQANAVDQLAAKVQAFRASYDEQKQFQENIERSIDQVMDPNGSVARRLQMAESLEEYRGLHNPLADWLHGVVRFSTGEPNRASDLFRNAAAVDGKRNQYVLADLVLAEQAASGLQVDDRVWVIHEDGTGPSLQAFRFDLKVHSREDQALWISMELPYLRQGNSSFPILQVHANGKIYETETLLNIDRYAATEFQAAYEAVVMKAVAGTVIKTLLQVKINENTKDSGGFGSFLRAVTPLATAAITQAETRIWRALPRTISIASIPRPAEDKIYIESGELIREIVLPRDPFVLVTVKTLRASSSPYIEVAALGG